MDAHWLLMKNKNRKSEVTSLGRFLRKDGLGHMIEVGTTRPARVH